MTYDEEDPAPVREQRKYSKTSSLQIENEELTLLREMAQLGSSFAIKKLELIHNASKPLSPSGNRSRKFPECEGGAVGRCKGPILDDTPKQYTRNFSEEKENMSILVGSAVEENRIRNKVEVVPVRVGRGRGRGRRLDGTLREYRRDNSDEDKSIAIGSSLEDNRNRLNVGVGRGRGTRCRGRGPRLDDTPQEDTQNSSDEDGSISAESDPENNDSRGEFHQCKIGEVLGRVAGTRGFRFDDTPKNSEEEDYSSILAGSAREYNLKHDLGNYDPPPDLPKDFLNNSTFYVYDKLYEAFQENIAEAYDEDANHKKYLQSVGLLKVDESWSDLSVDQADPEVAKWVESIPDIGGKEWMECVESIHLEG